MFAFEEENEIMLLFNILFTTIVHDDEDEVFHWENPLPSLASVQLFALYKIFILNHGWGKFQFNSKQTTTTKLVLLLLMSREFCI
jgi:hypothetical protein